MGQIHNAGVVSLNNESGPVTLTSTGATVTITKPTANTINLESSGFVNPMTTLGDIIYENATPAAARLAGNTTTTTKYLQQTGTGSVSAAPSWSQVSLTSGVTGDLPTANGGSGASNEITYNAAFGIISDLVAPTNYVAFTTNDANEITSMVAPSPAYARIVTIINDFSTPGVIQIDLENSSYTAANRFNFDTGSQPYYEIPYKSSATFIYSPTDARWKLLGFPQYANGNGLDGVLSSSDYSFFTAKQNPVAGLGGVAFSGGSQLTNDPSYFFWDDANYRLGLNLAGTTPLAGLQLGSPTPLIPPSVNSGSGNLVNVDNLFNGPSTISAYQDESGSGYTANGSSYTYGFTDWIQIGGAYFGSPQQTTIGLTDNNDGNPFQWDLFYTQEITASGTLIQNFNEGIIEFDSGYVGNQEFIDNNDMVNNGVGNLPIASSYIQSNGSILTRGYTVYAFFTIGGVTVYSPTGYAISTTDPDDGGFYIIGISWSSVPGAVGYKILYGSGSITVYGNGNTQIADYNGQSFGGDTTVTPNSAALPAISAAGDIQATSGNFVSNDGSEGFTGSGLYTNLTIKNGIITAAS